MIVFIVAILFFSEVAFTLDDRYHTYEEVHQQLLEWNEEFGTIPNSIPQYPGSGIVSVSYTHLTLQTIYSV